LRNYFIHIFLVGLLLLWRRLLLLLLVGPDLARQPADNVDRSLSTMTESTQPQTVQPPHPTEQKKRVTRFLLISA
jgi:hypothetical protein